MSLKKIFFASLVAVGLVSACGKVGELSNAEMKEVQQLPEGKKLKELSAEDAEKALKLMRKSLAVFVSDDAFKARTEIIEEKSEEYTKKVHDEFTQTKELIADDARLKSALEDMMPLDVAQACVFADINVKHSLDNAEKIKKAMKDTDKDAQKKFVEEFNKKVKADTMKELKITDEERFDKIEKAFNDIKYALHKGIKKN